MQYQGPADPAERTCSASPRQIERGFGGFWYIKAIQHSFGWITVGFPFAAKGFQSCHLWTLRAPAPDDENVWHKRRSPGAAAPWQLQLPHEQNIQGIDVCRIRSMFGAWSIPQGREGSVWSVHQPPNKNDPLRSTLCWDIPLPRPYIGLLYDRYLQFKFLKWLLTLCVFNFFLNYNLCPILLGEFAWTPTIHQTVTPESLGFLHLSSWLTFQNVAN